MYMLLFCKDGPYLYLRSCNRQFFGTKCICVYWSCTSYHTAQHCCSDLLSLVWKLPFVELLHVCVPRLEDSEAAGCRPFHLAFDFVSSRAAMEEEELLRARHSYHART